jgi:hypothetical protein
VAAGHQFLAYGFKFGIIGHVSDKLDDPWDILNWRAGSVLLPAVNGGFVYGNLVGNIVLTQAQIQSFLPEVIS